MSKKKEKLLLKYLEKKKKQRKRDDILAQIAEIEARKKLKLRDTESNVIKDMLHEDCKDTDNKNSADEKSESSSEKCNDETCADNSFSEKNMPTQANNQEELVTNKQSEIPIYRIKNTEKDVCEFDSKDEISEDTETNDNCISEESASISDIEDIFKEDYQSIENVECPYRTEEIQNIRMKLPIFYEQASITSKIRNNRVILIKGQTGCGKTTQIPQFLYEAGFANNHYIGVTQPRRISAISVSNRINVEVNEQICGYKIRYDSNITKNTKIKIMTDGILLNEIQEDFLLSKYSVILLDEIHERSANLDILIALLSKIIKLRNEQGNELKLILMSASEIDKNIVSRFDNIKIIEVESNTFKVSTYYEDKDPLDYIKAAYDRILRIMKKPDDSCEDAILVFLPSKSDIYKLKDLLESVVDGAIILPLHSSLSKDDQNRVYENYTIKKIILSTNIAETSITIPDIVYVIDSGLFKSKYTDNTGIVEYNIDYISKSSAQQRAGRAGRTKDGICYRLYSGDTFSKFDDLNKPKILCEPLDEIVFKLISLGVPDISKFPFLNKPSTNSINLAINNLRRLGFINNSNELTKLGKAITDLPFSPRIAKMLCIPDTIHILPHLIILVCLLSINVEFSRNTETEKYFKDEKSDLIVLLKIFTDYLKHNNKKEFCRLMSISLLTFIEVEKMVKMVSKKLKLEIKDINRLNDMEKAQIRRIIFLVNLDRVAIPNESTYWHKNKDVYLSNNSIDVNGEHIVFEYLMRGSTRLYMKNITIIDSEWFN